jgi:hypothetical protein
MVTSTTPSRADFFFQVVFVATAMSIISGAVAERMKLWAFLAFAVVMTGFIYPIQGFWSWGGGFLDEMGYVDYAGSGIVHFTGAVAALAGCAAPRGTQGQVRQERPDQRDPGCRAAAGHAGRADPVAGLVRLQRWFGTEGVRYRVPPTTSPQCSRTPTSLPPAV